MVMLGEPVISSRPMPPPRVNEAKVRALAKSSVVVATLMLWPALSAARNAGTVNALARAAPCGSAQARRTSRKLVLLDPALDLFGLPSLLIAPQAVPFDETQRLRHLRCSIVKLVAPLAHTGCQESG